MPGTVPVQRCTRRGGAIRPLTDAATLAAFIVAYAGLLLRPVAAQSSAAPAGPVVNVGGWFGNQAGNRRLAITFTPVTTVYAIVGHLGADGVIRIVFPATPADSDRFEGGRTVVVPPFEAGFESEYAADRRLPVYQERVTQARITSYDGQVAYLFVIASHHPLRLGAAADDGAWANWNLTDVDLLDPQPTIKALAASLAPDGDVSVTYLTKLESRGTDRRRP